MLIAQITDPHVTADGRGAAGIDGGEVENECGRGRGPHPHRSDGRHGDRHLGGDLP